MTQHPTALTLRSYAERHLDTDEMTAVIRHIDQCHACFDQVAQLFSDVGDSFRFADNDAAFHLDYDEHLRPYVDREADVVTRELVESHTQACSVCAVQLRELREFAESLKLHEAEVNRTKSHGFVGWLVHLTRSRSMRLAVILVAMLGVAAFLIYLRNGLPAEQAPTQPTDPAETLLPTVAQSTRDDDATPEVEVPNRSIQGKTDELAGLPVKIRESVEARLRTGRLDLPEYLAILSSRGRLRGNERRGTAFLMPDGETVRSKTPELRWNGFASKGNKYVVEIFDENDDPVMVSQPITTASWRPERPLERGRVYKWEVRSESPDGERKAEAGKFLVLEARSVREVDAVAARSPFIRGVTLASNGLLTEAAAAFRHAVSVGDRPELARTFLRQLARRR